MGVVIYILTISKYFIKINVNIINFIKKILLYPIKLICTILSKILKPFSFIVININNIFQKNVEKCLKNKKDMKKCKKQLGKEGF